MNTDFDAVPNIKYNANIKEVACMWSSNLPPVW